MMFQYERGKISGRVFLSSRFGMRIGYKTSKQNEVSPECAERKKDAL